MCNMFLNDIARPSVEKSSAGLSSVHHHIQRAILGNQRDKSNSPPTARTSLPRLDAGGRQSALCPVRDGFDFLGCCRVNVQNRAEPQRPCSLG